MRGLGGERAEPIERKRGASEMKDEEKSKKQLISELFELRQRMAALEASAKKQESEEEALLQKTSELRAVFRAFPDLFFRLDSDGTIVDYLTGRTSYLYVAPEAFLGKRMQDVLPPGAGQQFHEAVSQVLKTKKMVSIEYELPMPTGQQSYEARLLPLLERQVVVVIRDITERRLSEKEIKKLNDDLELPGRGTGVDQHGTESLQLLGLSRPSSPASRDWRVFTQIAGKLLSPARRKGAAISGHHLPERTEHAAID